MSSATTTTNGPETTPPLSPRGLSAGTKAAIGAAVWAAFVTWDVAGLQASGWMEALLLLSALVLAPLARELTEETAECGRPAQLAAWARRAEMPAALALVLAMVLPQGVGAALATLPWLVLGGVGAVTAVLRIKRDGIGRDLDRLCGDAALVFLALGGVAALAERTGWRPLGLPADLMTLTAVHFHYAGLLLPLGAGAVVRDFFFSRFAMRAAVGVVLGVPAVAGGIIVAQVAKAHAISAAASWWLGLAALVVAIFHVRIGLDAKAPMRTRALFFVAGVTLFFATMLALLYSMRAFTVAAPWLNAAWMRALHGGLNALGFGLCGVFAWRRRRTP